MIQDLFDLVLHNLLFDDHVGVCRALQDAGKVFAHLLRKLYDAVDAGINGVILALLHAGSRVNLGAALANDNLAGEHAVSVADFYAKTLTV